jgi:hypothetical protein
VAVLEVEYVDAKIEHPIIWAIAIVLVVGTLIASHKDFTAAATIALAFATFVMARDSSNNIKISKNNLSGEHLIREMQDLIQPLYISKDEYEYRERVHIPYFNYEEDFRELENEAEDFWKDIDANKYLAPIDLRHLIEAYIEANSEWYDKYRENLNKLKESLKKEDRAAIRNLLQEAPRDERLDQASVIFDYRFMNLPQRNIKERRIKEIKELIGQLTQLNPESEFVKHIKDFLALIEEDTVLEAIRSDLRAKVIYRYEELETEIDKIRTSLE